MAKTRTGIKARRKACFYASLRLAGTTLKDWAEKQGVTPDHVRMVLSGTRDSLRLENEVDAFIEKHLPSQQQVA